MAAEILPCSSMNIYDNNDKDNIQKGTKRIKNYDTKAITNTMALAVIQRLQQWCFQLFWLTIVCVMSCCGDLQAINNKNKTLQDVRKSIQTASASNRRSRSVMELEMQLLRHLTSPQTAILRPTKPLKKRQLSRPPSPQLFVINESDSEESESENY